MPDHNAPGYTPKRGSGYGSLLDIINTYGSQIGYANKMAASQAEARDIANKALRDMPTGASSIVRILELNPQQGGAPGQFEVFSEASGIDSTKALHQYVTEARMRPLGKTIGTLEFTKGADGLVSGSWLGEEQVQNAINDAYKSRDDASIRRQAEYEKRARQEEAEKNTEAAREQQKKAKEEQRRRDAERQARSERQLLADRAAKGDKDAGQKLADEHDKWERAQRTARVAQVDDGDSMPTYIPPSMAGVMLGTNPKVISQFSDFTSLNSRDRQLTDSLNVQRNRTGLKKSQQDMLMKPTGAQLVRNLEELKKKNWTR